MICAHAWRQVDKYVNSHAHSTVDRSNLFCTNPPRTFPCAIYLSVKYDLSERYEPFAKSENWPFGAIWPLGEIYFAEITFRSNVLWWWSFGAIWTVGAIWPFGETWPFEKIWSFGYGVDPGCSKPDWMINVNTKYPRLDFLKRRPRGTKCWNYISFLTLTKKGNPFILLWSVVLGTLYLSM